MNYIRSVILGSALLLGLAACAGAPDQPAIQATSGAAPSTSQSTTTLVPQGPPTASAATPSQNTAGTVYPPPLPTVPSSAPSTAYPGAQTTPPYNPYPGATSTKAP